MYESLPIRAIFGWDTVELVPSELDRLNCSKTVFVCTKGRLALAERVVALVGERARGIIAEAVMHAPIQVTERAVAVVRAASADAVVAVGGGSAIGLAKAIGIRTGLPQIAVPTTYSGSEMTPILGETTCGNKIAQRSLKVLPRTVIYDVGLTTSLPLRTTAASGMNAMAHAFEALCAPDGNRIVDLLANESLYSLIASLERLADNPEDHPAREGMLYGAWLAGICIGCVSLGLHHKLCHVLGGRFSLPHAETLAILLPHVLGLLSATAPGIDVLFKKAVRGDNASHTLFALAGRAGIARGLKELGLRETDVESAADWATMAVPGSSTITKKRIKDLLFRAWAGLSPSEDPSA